MHVKPITSLTAEELRAAGAAAFDDGEEIIAASKSRNLEGLPLLFFEAGYFGRQEELRLASACEQGSG
ncbi:MAG: hypothetical protein V4730_11910 [Pseudomonadota bacterium]